MKQFVDRYIKTLDSRPLTILDIGSQDVNGSYKDLFDKKSWVYHGLDISPGKNVDIVIQSMYCWKEVKSNTYDVVISGQAFEHIEFPWLTMQEVARVLKMNGLCCIIAPSSGPEHKYPLDCWRFFPDGLCALAKYVGLEVLETYTCWEPVMYGEENIWKDSVLICKKRSNNPWKDKVKYRLIKIMNHLV